MNDLIRRKAAIDAINRICPIDTEYDCALLDRVDVRCVLSDLPSAEPERTAKVVHSTTFGEWKNMCGHCFAKGRKMGLFPGQNYCYECGCKLDWSE